MAGTFNGSRRIGILGGTFDPIHIGHLILAEEAWFQLRLDRIYLAPAGNPPHKRGRRMAPVEDRLCMAELATADVDYALISRIDADSWDGDDIPVGEESESYRIEIASAAGALKRTATAATQSWTYAAAAIAADFPVLPANATITVRQISAAVGAGIAARLAVTLT